MSANISNCAMQLLGQPATTCRYCAANYAVDASGLCTPNYAMPSCLAFNSPTSCNVCAANYFSDAASTSCKAIATSSPTILNCVLHLGQYSTGGALQCLQCASNYIWMTLEKNCALRSS